MRSLTHSQQLKTFIHHVVTKFQLSRDGYKVTMNDVIVISVITTRSAQYVVSVRPVNRQQQQQRLEGLLLRSGAGSRYQPIAAAAARHAGRSSATIIFAPPPQMKQIMSTMMMSLYDRNHRIRNKFRNNKQRPVQNGKVSRQG